MSYYYASAATLDRLRAMLSSCKYAQIHSNSPELWWSSISVAMGSLAPCCKACVLHTSPTWKLCHWTEMEPSLGVCVSRATSQPPGLQGLTNTNNYASNIMIHSFVLKRLGNQRLLTGCSFQWKWYILRKSKCHCHCGEMSEIVV
jgi:hypothetical protein